MKEEQLKRFIARVIKKLEEDGFAQELRLYGIAPSYGQHHSLPSGGCENTSVEVDGEFYGKADTGKFFTAEFLNSLVLPANMPKPRPSIFDFEPMMAPFNSGPKEYDYKPLLHRMSWAYLPITVYKPMVIGMPYVERTYAWFRLPPPYPPFLFAEIAALVRGEVPLFRERPDGIYVLTFEVKLLPAGPVKGRIRLKADEKAFLLAIAQKDDSESVRDIANRLQGEGLFCYKRALYILQKCSRKRWYEYGVSLDLGWLTQKGIEALSEVSA